MDYDFKIIPKRKILTNKIKKMLNKAQRNIDIIISKETSKAIFLFISDFQKTAQRGVKIRFITNRSEKISNWIKEDKKITYNPNFKIKFSSKIMDMRAGLFDNQKLIIATTPSTSFLESPALFTKNSVIIKLFINLPSKYN